MIATDDNWADFASNTEPSTEHSIHDKQSEKINKDDDVFGDYGEVQISPKSQISSLPIVSSVILILKKFQNFSFRIF